jgi:chromosome segregation protein
LHFTKLRLHGFKSFVDPTELLIEPGLTGIVGPNGCGKSNLVEALQWVMGESSARRLRGGEMDDVIFGGTATRPGRGVASVSLQLDNADRTAPGELADAESDELEIDRRIARGKGSTYRVNGKEARARDVQLLFADAASGAQSVSLIGQGRIGWLINARPAERRSLLEEAAGIGGLQARRHEAETRLAAAETNLVRLRDVEATLTQRIERLRKQARQAERYRRLSEQLRQAEALALYRHWLDQGARLNQAADSLRAAADRVERASALAAAAARARHEAQAALPALREREAASARDVERLAGALAALDADRTRTARAIEDLRQRLAQLDQDGAREAAVAGEAAAALRTLAAEAAALAAEQAAEGPLEAEAGAALDRARSALGQSEAALAAATARAAAGEATRQAVLKRVAAAEDRRRRVQRALAEAEAKSRELDLLAVPPARLEAAEAEAVAAETMLEDLRDRLERAEARIRQTEQARQAAREPAHQADRTASRLRAEIEALGSVLRVDPDKGPAPVLDGVTVKDGLDAALGAALGDDLLASADASAAVFWADLPDETAPPLPLPDGARPLAAWVAAPRLLDRRLARIGLVPDQATGDRLQALLAPGQRLVSPAGAVWRWDGLTTAAGASGAAAIRLAQRARLDRLETERGAADAALSAAFERERAAIAAFEAARNEERQIRAAQVQASQHATRCRQAQLALVRQQGTAEARRQSVAELCDRLAAELAEAAAQSSESDREQSLLPDLDQERRRVDELRHLVAQHREAERAGQRRLDTLVRDAAIRAGRIAGVARETAAWTARETAAAGQAAVLAERRAALDGELAALAARPAAIEAERAAASGALDSARSALADAAAALKAADLAAAEAERHHGECLARHGEAREDRVRAEALRDQAVETKAAAAARIRELFDCAPAELPEYAGLGGDARDGPTGEVEARVERLRREREALGPANLMAETELGEATAELATIHAESADLVEAIARFRQAIQQLNREGRDRLTKAFDRVNEHFQALFARLFGGGRAHLELSGGDGDPLAAGLEIMASPPGKKPQILSLLSGGERALTALALVFAVFLTNPAPVCVLDEVDAPLDDANVERFCALVREIATRAATRFLIVTHHRVTMARMDRLFGVTMIERGISRLVSVELDAMREDMRQSA